MTTRGLTCSSASARFCAVPLGKAVIVLVPHHSVWGGTPHVSSAPTQGHPSPGRSAFSLLRCGERPCDTLRALPENVAAPRGSRWAHLYATSGGCVEVSVASVATSGCPKRSEGGCPCRSEEGAEPRANPAGWFVVWACAPCLANWCGGGLSPFSVLLGDLAFCMWRGGNMRRSSLHPHAMSHRVSECNPGESLA